MQNIDEVLTKAKSWAENPYFSEEDRQELKTLIEGDQKDEIFDRFYKDLNFGTGGLRSVVGFGSNRMNIYNVRKASYALATTAGKGKSDKKVAISCDSRLTSEEFSKAVAEVFAGEGYQVYVVNRPTPTPLLSYAVRFYNCDCGVMLTASHNPSEYNGFKAYNSEGCQVTPPLDAQIIESFYSIEDWSVIKPMNFDEGLKSGKIQYFSNEFYDSYFQIIQKECLRRDLVTSKGDQVKIVYTPLHGTGGEFCERAAKELGFTNFIIVPEQAKPDGHFPTTSYPNPEEPESLKLAVDLMLKENADLALGSDPDTDRMGVVLNIEGSPRYLNGNEIAVLMLYYKLLTLKEQGKIQKNALVLKTIVTSTLQETLCKAFDVEVVNTLTGFKWMGGYLIDKEKKGESFQYIFGSEESFGSMSHDEVRDKDGVSSVTLFCELALYFREQGKNLAQVLEEISKEYGYHQESLLSLSYKGVSGEEKIKRIMNLLREIPAVFFPVGTLKQKEDFSSRSIYDYSSGEESKLDFPVESNVLGFEFENGNKLYARPSGTEPKIKFYSLFKGDFEQRNQTIEDIQTLEKFLEQYCEQA